MSPLEISAVLYNIANKYEYYTSIFILIIGLISNILIILTLTTLRIFRGNQCAYYLKIESVTDIGLLLTILPSNIAGYILSEDPGQLSIIWCKLRSSCSYACGLYSLFTICFLAFDQYLSTNHRPNWRQLSTLHLAHRITFFNICLALSQATLFLVFSQNGELGCTVYHPVLKLYFTYFYYPILSGILPFIINTLFSLLAYRNVRRIVRRQVPLERRQLDHQMTAMALARVICIFILGVPFVIFSIFQFSIKYNDDDYIEEAIFDLTQVLVYSLLYLNYSVS